MNKLKESFSITSSVIANSPTSLINLTSLISPISPTLPLSLLTMNVIHESILVITIKEDNYIKSRLIQINSNREDYSNEY